MNIDRFTKLLARAFSRTAATEVAGGQVRKLRRPRPLAPLLEKALDSDEEREIYEGTLEDYPGNVAEILDEHGLRSSLLTFNWDGLGPVSWSAGIAAIETCDRAYLCTWDELESYQLHAAADSAEALRVLVGDLLSSGSVVEHVPHHIWNNSPGLLDRQTAEDAFAALLDQNNGWAALVGEHYGRTVEPDHLQRSLDILRLLPNLDQISNWLDARDADDGSDVPESARRVLLREFLDRAYEECGSATSEDEDDDEGDHLDEHFGIRRATEVDLERIYGSANLLIGFPVKPPPENKPTSAAERVGDEHPTFTSPIVPKRDASE